MSDRRFVGRAVQHGILVATIKQNLTRGDDCATLTVDALLGATLADIADRTRVCPM